MKRSRPRRGATLQSADPLFEEGEVPAARRALLAHYDRDRRALPWRGEDDPYRIWVSEVMLQQTRVETVIPYYRRWLERFPDLATLAAADVDDVLLAWQGLGYYRRARGLHAGARMVREHHGGEVPADHAALIGLPGVGEYTAAAVASIAFGQAVGVVDGNVKRVMARLGDNPRPTARWLQDAAQALVDPDRPGDWNQALMELGATVCTPRGPRCGECPLAAWCRARAAGTQEERPAPQARKAVPHEVRATAVVLDGQGRALVVRRGEEGLLAGLWAFPDRIIQGSGHRALAEAARAAAQAAGVELAGPAASAGNPGSERCAAPDLLPPVYHRFTHLAVTYHPVVLAGQAQEDENRRWISLDPPWPVALPVAQQKIARGAATRPTT